MFNIHYFFLWKTKFLELNKNVISFEDHKGFCNNNIKTPYYSFRFLKKCKIT